MTEGSSNPARREQEVDWGNWVAIAALVVGVFLALLNYAHSRKLFRHTQYPALAIFDPQAKTIGDSTRVMSKIVNGGPRDIVSFSVVGFLACGLKRNVWYQSLAEKMQQGEEWTFTMTETLETDLMERFGGLYCEHGWHFYGKPKCFKLVIELSYVPMLAQAKRETSKLCYRLTPVVKEKTVTEWHFHQQSSWRRFLPFRLLLCFP